MIQGLSSGQGASLVQLKKQVLRLGCELSQASEAAEQEAKSMIAIGDQVYDDSGQVALDRLEESKVSLEKSKVSLEKSKVFFEESRRRAEASGRRALAARQGLVQLLEQRSLRLDEAERRIRGMTKLSRLREPSAWTETDILRMRLQILDQAYRGGVYHFLWSSRVFQASPVFSSIFNPKRRKSEQDTVEDKRLPFN
jgi:exonuclease VII small subunit